jgi:hypothetical protein
MNMPKFTVGLTSCGTDGSVILKKKYIPDMKKIPDMKNIPDLKRMLKIITLDFAA